MFQPAVPIAIVLQRIHSKHYVLPAIQREFVWNTRQICALFDSLLRGYPIGSFLLWNVRQEHGNDFTFYNFITDYHEKDQPYAVQAHLAAGHGHTAVLDGQQRLTALNIGLYGSHAERLPRQWWTNPNAFPKKRLHLNLLTDADDGEMGIAYDFRFLTDTEAKPLHDPNPWFRVGDVLRYANAGPAMSADLAKRLPAELVQVAYERLYQLYESIVIKPTFNAYLEESPDPDKVLDIFVRVNSGGTVLSYSDLLLSMATNQWKERDAREEVRSLVSDLNELPAGFQFTKDLVLKASLVLTEASDIRFKISNFTQANMRTVEVHWDRVRQALLLAANLLIGFGFTGRTLTAHNVMIPLAYYLDRRGVGSSYLESSHEAADRAEIRHWVARSLMKRGIWSGSPDTVLSRIRDEVRDHGAHHFPVNEIETALARLGRPLEFQLAEIDELLDLSFGSARVFPVLATLYPGIDFTKSYHEDHIYPKSLFSRTRLVAAGVPDALVDEYIDKVNRLPNLQLLSGFQNVEKQAKLPQMWLNGPNFPSDDARRQYTIDNDIDLAGNLEGFLKFYSTRKERMRHRLHSLLGVPQ